MLARILTTGLAVLLLLPALIRADDAPKGDKDLDGEWEYKSSTYNGKDTPQPSVGKVTYTFQGDTLIVNVGNDTNKTTIKVDAGQSPKTIDQTPQDELDKGRIVKGIYEVKDDDLRICFADAGKDRPTDFSSKEGSRWLLLTVKRVKK